MQTPTDVHARALVRVERRATVYNRLAATAFDAPDDRTAESANRGDRSSLVRNVETRAGYPGFKLVCALLVVQQLVLLLSGIYT
jgi:hypothetical protein